jgi:hypothetical protein
MRQIRCGKVIMNRAYEPAARSSPYRTLRSWVRITLEAKMCIRVLSVCVLPCVGSELCYRLIFRPSSWKMVSFNIRSLGLILNGTRPEKHPSNGERRKQRTKGCGLMGRDLFPDTGLGNCKDDRTGRAQLPRNIIFMFLVLISVRG